MTHFKTPTSKNCDSLSCCLIFLIESSLPYWWWKNGIWTMHLLGGGRGLTHFKLSVHLFTNYPIAQRPQIEDWHSHCSRVLGEFWIGEITQSAPWCTNCPVAKFYSSSEFGIFSNDTCQTLKSKLCKNFAKFSLNVILGTHQSIRFRRFDAHQRLVLYPSPP